MRRSSVSVSAVFRHASEHFSARSISALQTRFHRVEIVEFLLFGRVCRARRGYVGKHAYKPAPDYFFVIGRAMLPFENVKVIERFAIKFRCRTAEIFVTRAREKRGGHASVES